MGARSHPRLLRRRKRLDAGLSADGSTVSLNGGRSLRLPPGAAPSSRGGRVTVGMRPEHLKVAEEESGDSIFLEVELVEPLGADTLVHGRLDGAEITARLPGHATCAPGQRLSLEAEPKNLHLFDAETGKRI